MRLSLNHYGMEHVCRDLPVEFFSCIDIGETRDSASNLGREFRNLRAELWFYTCFIGKCV